MQATDVTDVTDALMCMKLHEMLKKRTQILSILLPITGSLTPIF